MSKKLFFLTAAALFAVAGWLAVPLAAQAGVTAAVTTASAPLRRAAVSASAIVARLPAGTKLTVTGDKQKSEWLPVETADGVKGYVRAQDVEIRTGGQRGASPAAARPADSTAAPRLDVHSAYATHVAVPIVSTSMRREGTAKSAIIARLPEGMELVITGDIDSEWLAVKIADGVKGYVRTRDVEIRTLWNDRQRAAAVAPEKALPAQPAQAAPAQPAQAEPSLSTAAAQSASGPLVRAAAALALAAASLIKSAQAAPAQPAAPPAPVKAPVPVVETPAPVEAAPAPVVEEAPPPPPVVEEEPEPPALVEETPAPVTEAPALEEEPAPEAVVEEEAPTPVVEMPTPEEEAPVTEAVQVQPTEKVDLTPPTLPGAVMRPTFPTTATPAQPAAKASTPASAAAPPQPEAASPAQPEVEAEAIRPVPFTGEGDIAAGAKCEYLPVAFTFEQLKDMSPDWPDALLAPHALTISQAARYWNKITYTYNGVSGWGTLPGFLDTLKAKNPELLRYSFIYQAEENGSMYAPVVNYPNAAPGKKYTLRFHDSDSNEFAVPHLLEDGADKGEMNFDSFRFILSRKIE
ncbi:MAG: SH3 domain-containing protein [Treponematales bacterium]